MTRLANFELSKSEVNRLLTKSFYSNGGEAAVCCTNNPHTLYKIFIKGHLTKVVPMSENKLRKLEKIHELQLKGCVRPLKTISCEGQVIGYEMTYDPDDIRFQPSLKMRSETVACLEETRDILQYFASQDITYCDVASRNILRNRKTGEVKFCDIDNIRLGEYPVDLIPTVLRDYSDICGIDQNTDAYMHNLLTLNTFGLDLYYSDSKDIRKEFKRKATPIFESMKEPEKFTGEYIIQYVKKKK